MGDMRRGVLGLSAGLTALALAPLPSTPAVAGCAARELSVAGDLGSRQSPVVLVRGEEVTVDGRRFIDGCDDTGGGDAFGCSTDEPEPEIPVEDARLELLESAAGEHGLVLGEADADHAGRVSWTVTIPVDAPLGRGVLVAAFSDGLHVVVRPSDARRTGPS
jgi:hypothetical protein